MFPKKVDNESNDVAITISEIQPKKRKRSTTSTDLNLAKKKIVTLRISSHLLKSLPNATSEAPPSIKLQNTTSRTKSRTRPKISNPLPSDSTDPRASLKSSSKNENPVTQCNASTLTHDAQVHNVHKVHRDGTLQISPCNRCFKSCRQCIKTTTSKCCSYCLQIRKKCEGAVELGRWIDIDGKRVIHCTAGADGRYGETEQRRKWLDIGQMWI